MKTRRDKKRARLREQGQVWDKIGAKLPEPSLPPEAFESGSISDRLVPKDDKVETRE